MDELTGKVAVVTGAASGIGLAMAERFARDGMRLALADVDETGLEAAAKSIADRDVETLAVPTDVASSDAVEELARQTFDRFGNAHVICNNAGVVGHGNTNWEGTLSDWEWVLGVNLMGVVHGIRAFVPRLVEQNEGHVVNTASLAGLGAIPFMAPYSATKHAVVAISEALFHELQLSGSAVRVTVLCPGFLNTRIAEFGRNWPERLGPRPELSDDPGAQFIRNMATTMVEQGPSPTALADAVADAITTGRYMITTDAAMTAAAMSSRQGQVDGNEPVLPLG